MDPSWSILQVFVSNYWSQGKGEGCTHFEIWHPDLRPDVLYKKVLKLSLRRKHFGAKELLKKRNLQNIFDFLEGFPRCLNPSPFPSLLWAFSCFASTGQRYYELACVICCRQPYVRHIVTVTRLLVVSQFD